MNLVGSANQRVKAKMNQKFNTSKFQSKSSLMRDYEGALSDFVTDEVNNRLNELGVTLSPQVSTMLCLHMNEFQEMNRFVQQRPANNRPAETKNQAGKVTQFNNNNLNNFDTMTGTEVKIVNGYRQRVLSNRSHNSRSNSSTHVQFNSLQPQNNRNQSKRSNRSNPIMNGDYHTGQTHEALNGMNLKTFLATYGDK